jgi:hypothetical protein
MHNLKIFLIDLSFFKKRFLAVSSGSPRHASTLMLNKFFGSDETEAALLGFSWHILRDF